MAETCSRCAGAARAQAAAEAMTARLFAMLVEAEAREERQRDEIGALEARLTRHLPTWEPS